MYGWMRQCADLGNPLYERMKDSVLTSKVMQTDDTLVNVLDPSLPRARIGRIWIYVGDQDHPCTVYDCTPTRSRDGPDTFMKESHGYLQADAYSDYDELYRNRSRNITEVGCWAQARRRFFEAQSSDLMHSSVILAYIRLLYDVERETRTMGLTGETRKAPRQTKPVFIL
jgi:hypothetical protein